MKRILCFLFGHRPYFEGSENDGPIYGGIIRSCLRCGATLPGDIPEVGDRIIWP